MQAWAALGIAATSVGNAIASSVAPVLVPLLNELATWISAHRQDVADFFTSIAKSLGDWSKTSGPREMLEGLKEIGREVLGITKNLLAMMQALGISPSGAATAGIGAAIMSKIPGAAWLMRTVMARFPWLAAASLSGDTPGGGTGPQSQPDLQETQRRNDETNQRYGYNGNLWHDVWHWIGSGFRPGQGHSQDTPSATKDQFLAKWGPQARRIAAMVGTSPENILAHWAQETAWGTHEHDNNVGNLQAVRPGPNTVSRGDTHADGSHYTAPFFTYANPAAAADAYADWIVRHGAVGAGLGESPAAYGERLRRAHYMENPNAPTEIARTRGEVDRVESNPHPGAPPFDPGRPSLTAPRSDPRLPDASGPPAPLPSAGTAGSAGANGKVDMNVRIVGQPAVVTSKTSGDVNLNVASPGLVMGY